MDDNLTIHIFPGDKEEKAFFTYIDYLDGNSKNIFNVQNFSSEVVFTSHGLSTSSRIGIKCETKPKRIAKNGKIVNFDFQEKTKVMIVSCPKKSTKEIVVKQ